MSGIFGSLGSANPNPRTDAPTGQVSVRIYRPQGAKGTLPTVMYFHGGGWVLGSKNTHDRMLRDLTNGAQAGFVFVNYTPSPEAQFPVPIEQAYGAELVPE